MEHRHPPMIRVERLTDDQIAMLRLLGDPPEIGRRSIKLAHDTPAALAKAAPGISRGVVKEYSCPVVEVLGAPRMVLPNGDLSTVPSGR